jgi:peptidoglycan-associated lipoprotein
VHKYLIELGIDSSRLTVVSYGKERPFCKDREEGCYQKNRRGHIAVRVQ